MLLMKWLGAKVCDMEQLVQMKGHEVVILPLTHCVLNPVEMAWSQAKGHIKVTTKGIKQIAKFLFYNIYFKTYTS